MIEDERHKKAVKSNNIFMESPIKAAEVKKDDKVQKTAEKVQ